MIKVSFLNQERRQCFGIPKHVNILHIWIFHIFVSWLCYSLSIREIELSVLLSIIPRIGQVGNERKSRQEITRKKSIWSLDPEVTPHQRIRLHKRDIWTTEVTRRPTEEETKWSEMGKCGLPCWKTRLSSRPNYQSKTPKSVVLYGGLQWTISLFVLRVDDTLLLAPGTI